VICEARSKGKGKEGGKMKARCALVMELFRLAPNQNFFVSKSGRAINRSGKFCKVWNCGLKRLEEALGNPHGKIHAVAY
jgi:hypothetical protein